MRESTRRGIQRWASFCTGKQVCLPAISCHQAAPSTESSLASCARHLIPLCTSAVLLAARACRVVISPTSTALAAAASTATVQSLISLCTSQSFEDPMSTLKQPKTGNKFEDENFEPVAYTTITKTLAHSTRSSAMLACVPSLNHSKSGPRRCQLIACCMT